MKTFFTVILVIVLLGGIAWLAGNKPTDMADSTFDTNSGATTGSQNPVIAEEVTYFGDIKGYYVRPATEAVYPGVVMVHEWWGLNDNIRQMARKLAAEGYQVMAVNLYGVPAATTTEQAQALRTSVSATTTTANLRAATAFLRSKGSQKIASLGWCYGGGKSLELALSGEPLAGTVIYYGTPLSTSTQRLSAIEWPVLGIFGDQDRSIPTTTVESFRTALNAVAVPNQIHIYPGVGHAFANPSGANYAPAETADAWAKTLLFLASTTKR